MLLSALLGSLLLAQLTNTATIPTAACNGRFEAGKWICLDANSTQAMSTSTQKMRTTTFPRTDTTNQPTVDSSVVTTRADKETKTTPPTTTPKTPPTTTPTTPPTTTPTTTPSTTFYICDTKGPTTPSSTTEPTTTPTTIPTTTPPTTAPTTNPPTTTPSTTPKTTPSTTPPTTPPTTRRPIPLTRRCKCELWVGGYDGNSTKMVNLNYVTLQFVRTTIRNAVCSQVTECGPVCKTYVHQYIPRGVESGRSRFSSETVGDYLCDSVRTAVEPRENADVTLVARIGGCTDSYTVSQMSPTFCCSKDDKVYKHVDCASEDAVVG